MKMKTFGQRSTYQLNPQRSDDNIVYTTTDVWKRVNIAVSKKKE